MPNTLRTMSLVVAIALLQFCGLAVAQAQVKQIKLTEKQVEGFIAAQKDMTAITEKMQGGVADKPDPKTQSALESAAKKYGFKDFAEFDDVGANIAMIMSGIDPQTKEFSEPQAAIKKEIEEITADKSLTAADKKQALDDLNAALKSAAPIQHASNIDLVKKYFDKLDAALQ
jgi:hypothetical protein